MTGAEWIARGLTFGSVATDYERFRLGYPPELVDLVRGHTTLPLHRAVEIGAGTGKATRVFTAAGIAVTAIEPDPAMLAELGRQVTGPVEPVLCTFEQYESDDPVDLVYAAAALHWTDRESRWARIADLLRPDGVVASFGGAPVLTDDVLRERLQEAGRPQVENDDLPMLAPDPDRELRWPSTELADEPSFVDVRQVVLERRPVLAADTFVGHLATVSAYLLLPPDLRAVVLARIRAVLPDRVAVTADITVHLARRR